MPYVDHIVAWSLQVPVEKCGYYEDRRPASNLDPYVVTRLIAETVGAWGCAWEALCV